MIKLSFLNSLKGLKMSVAETKVLINGYNCYSVPEGSNITLAHHNTIILWQKNNLVELACTGDPLELEND